MPLREDQIENIVVLLKNTIREKFKNYKPETTAMPFHTRLLGRDRLALYSFIHSLNTNFGSTMFKPVALEIAASRFEKVDKQVKVGESISSRAVTEINSILHDLNTSRVRPNKKEEIERIRKVSTKGDIIDMKMSKADICLQLDKSTYYFIDIKTAKPNTNEFKGFKRTLLEWTASFLLDNPEANINTLIAIPYNPYEPEPYQRWTMAGMLDLDNELKVADELWNFLGDDGAYEDLLNTFERVGIEMREEIDEYFNDFVKR